MATPAAAIHNRFLDALLARVQTEFRTTNYSQRLATFARKAPTVPEMLAAAKAGAYFQWCEENPMDIAGFRQQRNHLLVQLLVVVEAQPDVQERVGLELLADLEAIVIGYNAWIIELPGGVKVPVAIRARGAKPTNANANVAIAGGALLIQATYATWLGNPRVGPRGPS